MISHTDLVSRLDRMGLRLPTPPPPVAAYVPWVRSGSLIFVSGQLPMIDGRLAWTGRVPDQVAIDDARLAARQCALNGVSVLADALGGDLGMVRRIVRLGVFVQCVDGFTEQPKVANGASDFLRELLGESGRHARAAVGVNALPLGAPVEVELVAEVAGA